MRRPQPRPRRFWHALPRSVPSKPDPSAMPKVVVVKKMRQRRCEFCAEGSPTVVAVRCEDGNAVCATWRSDSRLRWLINTSLFPDVLIQYRQRCSDKATRPTLTPESGGGQRGCKAQGADSRFELLILLAKLSKFVRHVEAPRLPKGREGVEARLSAAKAKDSCSNCFPSDSVQSDHSSPMRLEMVLSRELHG
jgi:hypothetical protein